MLVVGRERWSDVCIRLRVPTDEFSGDFFDDNALRARGLEW
jgi:hypothetical protein